MSARRRGVEISLHSTRFRASSSRKLGLEQKNGMRVEGEGSEGNSVSSSPLPPPPPLLFFFFVAPALTLAL